MSGSAQARPLPAPRHDGAVSLERALCSRRTLRQYGPGSLKLAEAAQLLWAAQGISHEHRRTAPSGGALYPLELYLVAGDVDGLDAGLYQYAPSEHSLQPLLEGDHRRALAAAALDQHWVADGAAVLVITAVGQRTTYKYGERGWRYIHMEAGHAAQNALLQAVVLGVGAVCVGAFEDDEVSVVLHLPMEQSPLYLLPVGRP